VQIDNVGFHGVAASPGEWATGLFYNNCVATNTTDVELNGRNVGFVTAVGIEFVCPPGAGNQSTDHFIVSCRMNFLQAAVRAGDLIEGIRIVGCSFVMVDIGIDWVCAGGESTLQLIGSHINAITRCVRIVNVADTNINGNALFRFGSASPQYTCIEYSGLGRTTINGNAIIMAASNAGDIGISIAGATWPVSVDGNAIYMINGTGIAVDAGSPYAAITGNNIRITAAGPGIANLSGAISGNVINGVRESMQGPLVIGVPGTNNALTITPGAAPGGVVNFTVSGTGALNLAPQTNLAASIMNIGAGAGNGHIANIAAIAGTYRMTRYYSGSFAPASLRWEIGTDATAEAGADAGCSFRLAAYSDTGTNIGTAFLVRRSDMMFLHGGGMQINAPFGPTWTSGDGPPTDNTPIGSLYSNITGALGARLYVSAGAGNWNAVAGV
jgi:hypothetical protein